jgi:hypothetical protein
MQGINEGKVGGAKMMTQKSLTPMLFLLVAIVFVVLSLAPPVQAQALPIDMTTACNGGACFNWSGIYQDGTSFVNTLGMDNGQSNGCAVQPPCPAAYGNGGPNNTSLELVTGTGTPTPPPSLTLNGITFDFGPVNTTPCGPTTSVQCMNDMIQLSSSGVNMSVAPNYYSTLILLGTAVNGPHTGTVTINYSDGSSDPPIAQTFSDWCGFSGNKFESIAVGPISRINMDGTLIGPGCNLYAYTYPVNVNKEFASVSISSSDTSCTAVANCSYVLAATLKPPSYVIEGGAASPASVAPGSSSTATVSVTPQTGYTNPQESSKTITLSCSILPNVIGDPVSAATPPSCSLSPTSVTIVQNQPPPTTTLTFTAASPSKTMLTRHSSIFYAFLLIPGVMLMGLGFAPRTSRRKRLFGLFLLGLLLAGIVGLPACVSYTHPGNVGTPPGQYTVSITGVDTNGLTQASNPSGTSNTVVVIVANQ